MVTYPNGGKSYFHVSKDIRVILDENLTTDRKTGTDRHKYAVAISEKQKEKLHFHIGDEICTENRKDDDE